MRHFAYSLIRKPERSQGFDKPPKAAQSRAERGTSPSRASANAIRAATRIQECRERKWRDLSPRSGKHRHAKTRNEVSSVFGVEGRKAAKPRDKSRNEGKKMVRSQSLFPTFKSTSKKADFQCFFLKFGTSWHVSRRPPCRDFWGNCGEFQLKRGKNGEVFECNQPPQTGSQTIVPVNLRCKNIAFLSHFSIQTGKFWGRKQKIDARCRNRSDTAVLYRDYPMKISPSGDCELKT